MVDPKELVREYIKSVWNHGDEAAFERLTTPDFTYRLGDQPARDRAGMLRFIVETRTAFPDWRVEVDEIISEGDAAAARWSGLVTHAGAFHGIPPTGRKIRASGINVYRIVDGKIWVEWEQTDSLSMLRLMGALPGP